MKPPIPPSWIDALLVLASPLHPPATIMLAVVLIIVRRWSWLCYYGLLPLARQTEITPWSLTFLPGLASYMSSADEEELEIDPEPEPPRSDQIPHMNHVEPRSSGSENPPELALSASEIASIGRMIEHNKTAARPSKSSTIQAGFGVSRGGGQTYQRASAIYDALFGVPAPAVQYRQPDGSAAPGSYPVTGRIPGRTRAR